jgi:hypothetical protein
MQSTVSLPLKLIELLAVAPADDDRLTPLLHLRSQCCQFSLCCSWWPVCSTHGSAGRDGIAAAPRRPGTSLGIGLSWACT